MNERRSLLLLGAAAFVVYALSAPSVVNGDGLGYLRPLKWNPSPAPVPGHLLYVPLLSLLRRLAGSDLMLEAARLVNALAGAVTVVFAGSAYRRLLGAPRDAFVGALGLAASWGLWGQASDVETYALALAALTGAFACLAAWREHGTAWWALAAGLATAVAALFHVENLLFFLAVAVWILDGPGPPRRRLGHAALALAAGGLTVIGAYLLVAFVTLGKSIPDAWAWFRGAGHGFVYLVRPYNVTDALQGLARALVHAPYVHEADPAVVIGQLLFGAAALAIALGLPLARRRALAPLPTRALLAWAAPYALLGFLFFATDPERWLFLLPLIWLLFAAARPGRWAQPLAAALVAVNLVTAVIPGMTDIGPRWRARAVEAVVDDGDLVIFPGHDWDEYIGFYDPRNVRVFPLTFFIGAFGVNGGLAKLERAIGHARARGGQVWVVRVYDDDPGPRGWNELALLGFGRETAATWFRTHFTSTALDPIRGVSIVRLEAPQKSEGATGPGFGNPR